MSFNLNECVRIKLNERGYAHLRSRGDELNRLITGRGGKPPENEADRRRREADANDGWTKWQLWDLMNSFGEITRLGLTPPFETTIELLVEGRAADQETR